MAHKNDDTSDNSTLKKIVDENSVADQKTKENIGSDELVNQSKEDQKDEESRGKPDQCKDNGNHEITSELLGSIREKLKSFSMELDPNINIDQQRRHYFESWKKTNRISVAQWDQFDALLHLIKGTLSFFKAYHIVYDDADNPFVVVTIGRRDTKHHTYDVVVKKVTEEDGKFHLSAEGTQIRNATHLINDIFNLKTLGENEYESYESDLKSVPETTVARPLPARTPPRRVKNQPLYQRSDSGSGNSTKKGSEQRRRKSAKLEKPRRRGLRIRKKLIIFIKIMKIAKVKQLLVMNQKANLLKKM